MIPLPHHPDTAVQPMFVWPDGARRAEVPLETDDQLAAAGGMVTAGHNGYHHGRRKARGNE